jgi:hypothetical protein
VLGNVRLTPQRLAKSTIDGPYKQFIHTALWIIEHPTKPPRWVFSSPCASSVVLLALTFHALYCNCSSTGSKHFALQNTRRRPMSFICRRCNRITKQKLYRVTSEDAGVVMLNMLVCSSCARMAKKLGLPTVKMESAKRAEKIKRAPIVRQRPMLP